MIVTTQDLKQDYEINGVIRFYYSSNYSKQQLGKDMSMDDAVDFIIQNKLSKQAENLGADAIVGLTMSIFSSPGAMTSNVGILFYGTAVKLNN